jgi:phage terminase large subunit-like protein
MVGGVSKQKPDVREKLEKVIRKSQIYEDDGRWYMETVDGKLRIGKQTPRIDIYQNGLIVEAKEAFKLVKDYGNPLFKWQKSTLMRWLATDEGGRLVNKMCGLEVPRQNGKSELVTVRILYGMIARGEHIVFTAQSEETAETIKKRVLDFFYNNEDPNVHDLLADRWKKKHPYSLKHVELTTGGRCVFTTRHRVSGLGTTNDVLIHDEAQEMTDAQAEALSPTVAASALGNPQVIYIGTPPDPLGVGFIFKSIREKAMSGKHQICWREWSVENLHDPNDVNAWYDTNPSLNLTILEDTIRQIDLATLSDDSFNRQRLGWWSGTESKRAITDDQWTRLARTKDQITLAPIPELVYAIKIAPDRGDMTLSVGVELGNELIHVEVIDSKPFGEGHKWAVDFLSARWKKSNGIIIDGWYGKQIMQEDLVTAGVPRKRIIDMSMANIADAHVFFYEGVEQELVSHFDQPVLNVAVANTKRRALGKYGGFGWESMNPAEVSSAPIDSVTLAYWGAKTLPHLSHGQKKQRMRM